MTDFDLLLLALWGIYLVDGSRWSRQETTHASGLPGVSTSLRRSRFHPVPPHPFAWRAPVAEPGLSPGETGLSARPARSFLDPRPVNGTRPAWRWGEIRQVAVTQGTLQINEEPFAAADSIVSTDWIQKTARTPADARSARLDTLARQTLSPASWSRRWRLLLRATRAAALWNTATLLAAAALTALLFAPVFGLSDAWSDRLGPWLLPLAATTAAAYLGGVMAALLAAHRLRRWLPPKTLPALLLTALYPPQGLRWRLRLLERALPLAHPLTPLLAAAPTATWLPSARRAWCLWRHEALSLASVDPAVASWSDRLARRLEALLTSRGLSPASLGQPPRPDSSASIRYCPSCHAQFVISDGSCTCAVPLRPFPTVSAAPERAG